MRKMWILIALICCLYSVASAELGPVVVKEGRYRKAFNGHGYISEYGPFTVAMVEGGEWRSYASIDWEQRKGTNIPLNWEIVDKQGNVVDSGSGKEGYVDYFLPKNLEIGKSYELRLTWGDEVETLAFNVISEKESGLTRNGKLDIVGIEEGETVIPESSSGSSDYYIHYSYSVSGFERVHIEIKDAKTNRTVSNTDDNCRTDASGRTGKNWKRGISYNDFTPGNTYIITVRQGSEEVSRTFVVGKVSGYNPAFSGSGNYRDQAVTIRNQVAKGDISAADRDSRMIELYNEYKNYAKSKLQSKKKVVRKLENETIDKTAYFEKTDGSSFPVALVDSYQNAEISHDAVNVTAMLVEDIQCIAEVAKLPELGVYVYLDYLYNISGSSGDKPAEFTFLPFILTQDGQLFEEKLYVYVAVQIQDEHRAGGKKYTLNNTGWIFTEDHEVRMIMKHLYGFSGSSKADSAMLEYISHSDVGTKQMNAAISADEIVNMRLPVGKVTIRRDSNVNVRKEANLQSEVIGTAAKGKTYLLYEKTEDGWYEIELDNEEHGYIGNWMGMVSE